MATYYMKVKKKLGIFRTNGGHETRKNKAVVELGLFLTSS